MNLRLVDLTRPMFDALVAGDSATAAALIGLDIPPAFMASRDIWQFFIRLLDARPDSTGWTMNAVVDDGVIVGNAGFKGAPDADGMVEIGYGILPDHRRRGHAAAAVRLLLERAAADPRVRVVRAVVNPDNVASIAVVTRTGFTQQGDEIHPRHGHRLWFGRPPGI